PGPSVAAHYTLVSTCQLAASSSGPPLSDGVPQACTPWKAAIFSHINYAEPSSSHRTPRSRYPLPNGPSAIPTSDTPFTDLPVTLPPPPKCRSGAKLRPSSSSKKVCYPA